MRGPAPREAYCQHCDIEGEAWQGTMPLCPMPCDPILEVVVLPMKVWERSKSLEDALTEVSSRDKRAYQILEYGSIDVGRETIIRYQEAIGSDIGVILDILTSDVDYEKAGYTVEATLSRASEALKLIKDNNMAWVLPVQGGRYLDLVECSAGKASVFMR